MVAGNKLKKGEICDDNPYRELIGALMYLAVSTRPDIAYAVSALSQFNECHDHEHGMAAKKVIRYLKGTASCGLVYDSENHENLVGYADADWGSLIDRRSYSGFVMTLGGTAIKWESKKQRTVALSSTEAEYLALTEATKEMIYLSGFFAELCLENINGGIIYNDSHGAQKLANNAVFHSRTKHIDVRAHFIREAINRGTIKLEYLATEDMPADVLTKPLSASKHFKLIRFLGIKNLCALRGGVVE